MRRIDRAADLQPQRGGAGGRAEQIERRAVGDDLAGREDDHAIGERFDLVEIVRRQQHRLAVALQRQQDVVNLPPRDRIETRGRLIEDVEIRIVQHRHGQGEALPLSTGQTAHHRLGLVDEIDLFECLNNPA